MQDPTAGMWDRLAKPLCLCGGSMRAVGPVRATQGSQGAVLPPGPRGAGFGDQDSARHSPTSAEPFCPHGSPQTCHCGRGRIQGPTGEPESCVVWLLPGCKDQSPALSSCPSWFFMPGRQQSETNVPDSATLWPRPPSGSAEGRSCGC